jgi:diaminohydroxyphosphoribosylaminopyrimidine deaminase / 5-amino-6-(5-phosphoribosylamino)uracil reductase
MSAEQQLFFMQRALELGEKGRITAPPNPWVGCVLVKEGRIIGEGYHECPGKPHAEAMALQNASESPKGATAYVTLEPCFHKGRMPPCSEALIKAQVAKVVIPFEDPDPNVSGKGINSLRQAGIEVEVGLGKELCAESLAPYLHHRRTGKPLVHLKIACSLDGKYAAKDGSSQWITNEEARLDAHLLRAQSQAILIGRKTAERDRPKLTVRHPTVQATPLRVVLSNHSFDQEGPLFDPALGETLVYPGKDLEAVLIDLGKRGVLQLLVEGGGEVWTSFLKKGLADRLTLYQGNLILGEGKAIFGPLGIQSLSEGIRLSLINSYNIQNNLKSSFIIDK